MAMVLMVMVSLVTESSDDHADCDNGDDYYGVKSDDGDDVSGEQSLVRNDPVIESGLCCPMMIRSSFSALPNEDQVCSAACYYIFKCRPNHCDH